jgi:hypothetical protein
MTGHGWGRWRIVGFGSTPNVCGSSGGQLRSAQPLTEGALEDHVGHGEGGCSGSK